MSVFSWGSNRYGSLGLTTQKKIIGEPHLIGNFEGLDPVAGISCGDNHSLVFTDAGDIYSFGRGKDGQLGLGSSKLNVNTPEKIMALQHESVIYVASGALTSYAVTASGSVYHWGLIHSPVSGKESNSTTGQLEGLAADLDSVTINVDSDARIYSGTRLDSAPRQLREIVSHSEESWLLADGSNAEYYRELQAMGYHKDEADKQIELKGQDTYSMMRMGCCRSAQPIPKLITSVMPFIITKISAGYAHCMFLTDTGRLLASGYNDRGQLGLGHRISTSEFKIVDFLERKFVLQVACGQQHTLCRAIDREHIGKGSDGTTIGGDVYVWGNGMLGQLGLGRKGTTRGRLIPTLMTNLKEIAPLDVIDVASGSNFSVVVTGEGKVYSWGHAEYNQHGTGTTASTDYIDPYYYFTPREITTIPIDTASADKIVRVKCGSNFTLAISAAGDVFSWGWGALGVLGHGNGHFSSEPAQILSLGSGATDSIVVDISAGESHVLAVTKSSGCAWGGNFRSLLDTSQFADVQLEVEGLSRVFYCHGAILSARSTYFRGYLQAAVSDTMTSNRVVAPIPISGSSSSSSSSVLDNNNTTIAKELISVLISHPAANAITIQGLLEYLYTDRVSIAARKCLQLKDLATDLALDRLAALCYRMANNSIQQDSHRIRVLPSSFEADMKGLVGSEIFSDVIFTGVSSSSLSSDYFVEGELEEKNIEEDSKISVRSGHVVEIYGHKCVLGRIEYFNSLFSGRFQEAQTTAIDGKFHISLEGLSLDGIDSTTFFNALHYAYTGTLKESDADGATDLMSLLVAGNRLGLMSLVHYCEKQLSMHLHDYPENIENCYQFAQMFNIPRLERQCHQLLESLAKK